MGSWNLWGGFITAHKCGFIHVNFQSLGEKSLGRALAPHINETLYVLYSDLRGVPKVREDFARTKRVKSQKIRKINVIF